MWAALKETICSEGANSFHQEKPILGGILDSFDCVGVKRPVNPCGSFCVVSQKTGKRDIVEEMKEEPGR